MTVSTSEHDERVAQRYERVASASNVRAEAYVRTLAPPPGPKERQEAVLERMRELETHGVVDKTVVSVWGAAICLDGPYRETAACRRIADRLARFRKWAASVDGDVDLPFRTQTVSSGIVDSEYERVVTPQICLTLHADGDLALVLPCELGPVSLSITDVLDRLATVGGRAKESPDQSTSST